MSNDGVNAISPVWPRRPGQKPGPRKKLPDKPPKKFSGAGAGKGKKPQDNRDDKSIDEYV